MKQHEPSKVQLKNIGEPKTRREKYEKLKLKNSALELLKNAFDLKVEL